MLVTASKNHVYQRFSTYVMHCCKRGSKELKRGCVNIRKIVEKLRKKLFIETKYKKHSD